MRSELACLVLLAALLGAGAVRAADDASKGSAGAAQSDQVQQGEETDRPEYHARPLPTDTFTPAESLPEDFPVAFPTDM